MGSSVDVAQAAAAGETADTAAESSKSHKTDPTLHPFDARDYDLMSLEELLALSAYDTLSLQELLDLPVTSVSQRVERSQDVAASLYVLTSDDLRRLAPTRLQDLLALIPGVWVVEQTYDNSFVTMHENPEAFAVSPLLLLDGIVMNSPVTSAIFTQFTNIDYREIDRVEVIKGPGGTIYGANATTGIINIFTKNHAASPGLRVSAEAGTQGFVSSSIRYAWPLSDTTDVTLWMKARLHDGYRKNPAFAGDTLTATDPATGQQVQVDNKYNDSAEGNLRVISGGFRIDARPSEKMQVVSTAKGLLADGHRYMYLVGNYDPSLDRHWISEPKNYRVLLNNRVDLTLAPEHRAFAQLGFDTHSTVTGEVGGVRTTIRQGRFELQDNLHLWDINRLSFGVNGGIVQFTAKTTDPRAIMSYVDTERVDYLVGAFAQDTLSPLPFLDLTAGIKIELWTLVGNGALVSPTARIAVRPQSHLTFWAAASRSLTTPGYVQSNTEIRVTEQLPGLWVALLQADGVRPIEYRVYEAGARTSLVPMTTIDANVFINDIHDRIDLGMPAGAVVQPSRIDPNRNVIPLYYDNLSNIRYVGTEAVVRVEPLEHLRFELSHSWFHLLDVKSRATLVFQQKHEIPEQVWRARIQGDLPWDLAVAVWGMYSAKWAGNTKYDYVNQRPVLLPAQPGTEVRAGRASLQLNCSLDYTFLEHWRAQVWGQDLLSQDRALPYFAGSLVGYPRIGHRMFGMSLEYSY